MRVEFDMFQGPKRAEVEPLVQIEIDPLDEEIGASDALRLADG